MAADPESKLNRTIIGTLGTTQITTVPGRIFNIAAFNVPVTGTFVSVYDTVLVSPGVNGIWSGTILPKDNVQLEIPTLNAIQIIATGTAGTFTVVWNLK